MARRSGAKGARTAQEVRQAALRLFAEQGYAAVSMRQIAREVGVQVGALYLYTPDKQSLLADMMIDHLEALLAKRPADRAVGAFRAVPHSLSSDPSGRGLCGLYGVAKPLA